MRFLKSAHLAPTLVVTAVGFLLSILLFNSLQSLVVAAAVFCGQLSIGWSNDLVDVESDRAQQRTSKPLVNGSIKEMELKRAIACALPFCILLSILGPLGLWGGLTHLLGVGCGVAYNFYFKSRITSPLPYAIAFAALVSSVFIGAERTPPWWVVISGALLGVAAHFANVLKDMEQDHEIGILGLPQRLGSLQSIRVAGSALGAVALLLSLYIGAFRLPLIAAALVAYAALILAPKRAGFPAIMSLALLDVLAVVASRGALG
ncbi:unannotated protein [freshwater metagenome]|uniref:Unannotated protein n=1 Tax=freshwater metagenome TaxID=449393 RepID=A0A6J7B790_9ZZZZ|nr:hypothetical protein [Actinomycetota bacterium]